MLYILTGYWLLSIVYLDQLSCARHTNISYHEIIFLGPYVRIVQMNMSGKVVKKKKTGFHDGTKEPIFNETLNFDVAHNQVWI